MKKIVIAVIAAVSGLNVMAGAAELSGLKAGDVAVLMADTQITLPAVAEKARGVSSKIVITPTTVNWKDTMLVKFAKNTGIDVVMYVLDSVDLSPAKFADNGDGYLVRVDIKDADAPLRAAKLAGFRAVETVQVNRTVYSALEGGLMKSAAAGISEFYGSGYSRWMPEAQERAEAALRLYVKVLGENGIAVIKAEVKEVEGFIAPVITYQGKQVLFRSTGSAMTLAGAKAKMEQEIKALVSKGAVIVYSEAYKGRDEWGSAGGYTLDYILR